MKAAILSDAAPPKCTRPPEAEPRRRFGWRCLLGHDPVVVIDRVAWRRPVTIWLTGGEESVGDVLESHRECRRCRRKLS